MKSMTLVIIILGMMLGFASMAMAEEWYTAVERSSSDYRSSVGATIAEVNGAKYTPAYTATELQNTKAMVDTRQMAQAGIDATRANAVSSGSSVITGSSSGGGLRGGTNFQEFKK
jgi:protein-disulfide isomerase-like protein with CxxC motif